MKFTACTFIIYKNWATGSYQTVNSTKNAQKYNLQYSGQNCLCGSHGVNRYFLCYVFMVIEPIVRGFQSAREMNTSACLVLWKCIITIGVKCRRSARFSSFSNIIFAMETHPTQVNFYTMEDHSLKNSLALVIFPEPVLNGQVHGLFMHSSCHLSIERKFLTLKLLKKHLINIIFMLWFKKERV